MPDDHSRQRLLRCPALVSWSPLDLVACSSLQFPIELFSLLTRTEMSDPLLHNDDARPQLANDPASNLKHSTPSAKLSNLGKRFLSKRGKSQEGDAGNLESTRLPLFRRDSSQSHERQRQDVNDFLSAGGTIKLADPSEKRKIALLPPKLNTTAAKEATVSTIGTPTAGVPSNYDNGRDEPWVPRKSRRREGLRVAFLSEGPSVIGRGGDETDEPVIAVGQRRKSGLVTPTLPTPPEKQHYPEDDDDFIPRPMQRVQTGVSDDGKSSTGSGQAPPPPLPPGPPIPPIPAHLTARPDPGPQFSSSPNVAESVAAASPNVPRIGVPGHVNSVGAPLERNPSLRRMGAAEGMTFRLSGSFDPPAIGSEDESLDASHLLPQSADYRAPGDLRSVRPSSAGSANSLRSDVSSESTHSIQRKPVSLPNTMQRPRNNSEPPRGVLDGREDQPPPQQPLHTEAVAQRTTRPAHLRQEDLANASPTAPTDETSRVMGAVSHNPPPLRVETTAPDPRSTTIDSTTVAGYGMYVGHQSPIFRMAASSLDGRATAWDWARAATWWFLRARCGLEELVKIKISPGSAEYEAFKAALVAHQVNLGKVRWILLDVLPSYPEATSDMQVMETTKSLPRAFEALLRSMAKRRLLPGSELQIRSGLDTSIWIFDSLDEFALPHRSGPTASETLGAASSANPFASLPLNEFPEWFVVQRSFVRATLSPAETTKPREPFPVLLTVIRSFHSHDLVAILSTQSPSLDICASLTSHDHEDTSRLRMPHITFDSRAMSLTVPILTRIGEAAPLELLLRRVDSSRLTEIFNSSRAALSASANTTAEQREPAYSGRVVHLTYTSFLVSSSTRDLESSWRSELGVVRVFHPTSRLKAGDVGSKLASTHSLPSAHDHSRPTSEASDDLAAGGDEAQQKQKRSDRLKERVQQGRALLGKGLEKIQQHRHSRSRSGSRSPSLSGDNLLAEGKGNARLTLTTATSSKRVDVAQLLLLGEGDSQQVAIEPLDGQGVRGLRVRIKEDVELEIGRRARMRELVMGFGEDIDRQQALHALESWSNVGRWV